MLKERGYKRSKNGSSRLGDNSGERDLPLGRTRCDNDGYTDCKYHLKAYCNLSSVRCIKTTLLTYNKIFKLVF